MERDRQLAERKNDGITTSLWWVPGTQPPETYVKVVDDKQGEAFRIPVEAPATPNDVYNHPYTYIGGKTVEHAGVMLSEE